MPLHSLFLRGENHANLSLKWKQPFHYSECHFFWLFWERWKDPNTSLKSSLLHWISSKKTNLLQFQFWAFNLIFFAIILHNRWRGCGGCWNEYFYMGEFLKFEFFFLVMGQSKSFVTINKYKPNRHPKLINMEHNHTIVIWILYTPTLHDTTTKTWFFLLITLWPK